MGILDHIKSEWPVFKKAPFSFLLLIVLAFSSGFYIESFLKQQEITNYDSSLKSKEAQLENYRSQLDANNRQLDEYKKSIEERLDKVEKSLTENQVKKLEELLKQTPSKINFLTEMNSDSPYEKQWIDIFKRSGWDVGVVKSPGTKESFSIESMSQMTTKALTDALKGAGVQYKFVVLENSAKTEFRFEK